MNNVEDNRPNWKWLIAPLSASAETAKLASQIISASVKLARDGNEAAISMAETIKNAAVAVNAVTKRIDILTPIVNRDQIATEQDIAAYLEVSREIQAMPAKLTAVLDGDISKLFT